MRQRLRMTIGRRLGTRARLAARYLQGSGLEIGALHLPLWIPRRASVRYVDREGIDELRHHYPELATLPLVIPHILDDGERLETINDRAVDFVVANHMIEHCEDPIGTLGNHLRVLRPGGVLYTAVPDGRRTFDRSRPVTSLAHLRRDYEEGPEWSRRGHYEQWARLVERVPADRVGARADELERQRYSIHFHVWTPNAFLELLMDCRREYGFGLEVETCVASGHEFIVVMRRA